MAVQYDILPVSVQQTLTEVKAYADAVQSNGESAATEGSDLPSLCGTAQLVGNALVRFWAGRSQTGVRSGEYASGCADAVSQACSAIVEGDGQMQHSSNASSSVAAAAARFGQQRG